VEKDVASPEAPASGGRFQILALDGGGLKGLFSAQVLAHLDKTLGHASRTILT
jgi:patatin-like phospholipase/acyl hydrolase